MKRKRNSTFFFWEWRKQRKGRGRWTNQKESSIESGVEKKTHFQQKINPVTVSSFCLFRFRTPENKIIEKNEEKVPSHRYEDVDRLIDRSIEIGLFFFYSVPPVDISFFWRRFRDFRRSGRKIKIVICFFCSSLDWFSFHLSDRTSLLVRTHDCVQSVGRASAALIGYR